MTGAISQFGEVTEGSEYLLAQRKRQVDPVFDRLAHAQQRAAAELEAGILRDARRGAAVGIGVDERREGRLVEAGRQPVALPEALDMLSR